MKKAIFIFISISFSFSAFSKAPNKCSDSLKNHIKEALAHNRHFFHFYSELTNRKSEILSLQLMAMETVSLLPLSRLDEKSKIYHSAGIPVMCDEIVSMKLAPALKELLPLEKRPLAFTQINIKALSSDIKELLESEGFDDIYRLITPVIIELENNPQQNCLTRHFFESIARTIKFIPEHKSRALDYGLNDPTFISKKFLKLQNAPLVYNYKLDQMAFKLQKKGIPIFCNDVPPIIWK